MKSNIIPFVTLPPWKESKAIARKHNFSITNISARKMANGWIAVSVNWNKADCYFKYGIKGSTMYGGDIVSMEVEFNSNKLKHYYTSEGNRSKWKIEYSIEIGLKTLNGKDLNYRPLFFENWKYCVRAWFAPEDWDDYKGSRKIYEKLPN